MIFLYAECASKYACHGDTKQYLFGTGELANYYENLNSNDRQQFDERYSFRFPENNIISEEEKSLGKQFRTWVANFVKYQNPGDDWPMFVDSSANFNYQHATRDSKWEVIQNFDDEMCKFWDDINMYGKL